MAFKATSVDGARGVAIYLAGTEEDSFEDGMAFEVECEAFVAQIIAEVDPVGSVEEEPDRCLLSIIELQHVLTGCKACI